MKQELLQVHLTIKNEIYNTGRLCITYHELLFKKRIDKRSQFYAS